MQSAQPTTRDRLIGAAMQLFWEKGYGSTSVADVLPCYKVLHDLEQQLNSQG